MDKKATRPTHSQDKKDKWTSVPASAPRNNIPEALAQTQDSPQPLEYFPGSERTMSPPPIALEKAMDPSQASQPDTPTVPSASSCLSRSSTLNSYSTTQTQDSDITFYSQSNSSSDDTISVPSVRSSTFPAMGSYPVDRKSFPKGASIRVFEFPQSFFEPPTVFQYQSGASYQINRSTPGHTNRYFTWSDGQDGEITAEPNQAPPSRHLTFPFERSRNPGILEDTHFSMRENTGDATLSESSNMVDPLQKPATASDTEMDCTVFNHHQAGLDHLKTQTDVLEKSRLTSSERLLLALLESKQAGLHCERAPNPSFLSQRRKNSPWNSTMSKTPKESENVVNLTSQDCQADTERPSGPGSTAIFTSTIATSVATMEPEQFSTNELRTQLEDVQESRSGSPSFPNEPCGKRNREASSQDSDDDTSLPHEDYSSANEEDEDFTYDKLVESITNIVLDSSCVGNIEERGVPVELYVHNFLEHIMNHPKPAAEKQTLSLPIRSSLPIPTKDAPVDADEPDLHACGHGGNGGSSSGNKRKNEEASGHNRDQDRGDEDNLGDYLEETQSNKPQGAKKLKTGQSGVKLSCPFRKRNPIRFNVRSHANCALTSFGDFALLKRHIKSAHQKGRGSISCVRCKKQFRDQAALDFHLTRPDICSLRDLSGDEDPEDGITQQVEQALKDRAKGNNVRSWESLWRLLFPRDPSERIPGPEHEPPVELDEVQDHCYNGDSVREFIHKQLVEGGAGMAEHGFWYIIECLWHCRQEHSHRPSQQRSERDEQFKNMVRNELSVRECASQAQQSRPGEAYDPLHVVTPGQWQQDLSGPLPFGSGLDVYSSQFSPYPTFPVYASHLGAGGSQLPAPAQDASSEGAAQPAAPQHAHTTFPYGATTMLDPSGRPCSAAEGSAQRSSGQSSHSRDSGGRTQGTLDTQYTLDAALDPRPGGAAPCDGGHCSCSTSPGGIPGGRSTMPGEGSSDDQNLYGIGTNPFMRKECHDGGSNSDEDLAHFRTLQ